MKRLVVGLFCSWIVANLISCAAVWDPDERSGLGIIDSRRFPRFQLVPSNEGKPTGTMLEKTILRPIDPSNISSGLFDLYYFVRMPTGGKATKTVLFCPGGPGQFVPGPTLLVTLADFLTNNGYNVVFYHPRGAGFSQIPSSNDYDRFLNTSYVIGDIEAIRRNFLDDKKWNAVIGYSFGTVVAQQYAYTYKNLERLILIGTESRHGFQNATDSFDRIRGNIRDINRTTLTRILENPEFNSIPSSRKNEWIDRALGTASNNGIFQDAEDKFGSLGFLIGAYCQFEANNELRRNNLHYSKRFFEALRALRDFGWFPWPPTDPGARQVAIGRDIINEFLGRNPGVSDCGLGSTGSSDRVYNVVSIYDGINMRFLAKWLVNGGSNVQDAVKFSAGEIHYTQGGINKYVDKVGISISEIIEPWDPQRHKHNIPTMVLKGSADTVSADGAAEHIFLNALEGQRILIEFPGVGHLYFLPRIPSSPSTSSAPACRPNGWILDCLIYSFIEMSPISYDPDVNRILRVIITNLNASICYKDLSLSRTLTVAGVCPGV